VSDPVPPSASAPIEPAPAGRGCGKNVLIGCGIVALVLAAACLGLILYARSRPEMITDFVMKQIESHYAADVTETDKRELRDAYADFRQALRDRRVSRDRLDRMRATLMTGGSQNEIHHQQVRELIELYRRGSGSGPGTPEVSPSPAPSPSPSP
jgi:hypothetical protein